MARDRAKINTGIWGDRDWKSLTLTEQWLYTTILTRPDLNHVGVGDWRPRRLAKLAANVSADEVEAAAEGLQAKLFILCDDDSEEVLVRSFLKHDGVLQNPNLGASIKSAYDAVVSSKLQEVVVHELHKLAERDPELPVFTAAKSRAHMTALMRMPSAPITSHLNAGTPSENAVPKGRERRSDKEGTPFESGDPSSTTTTTATTTSSGEDQQPRRKQSARPLPKDWTPTEEHQRRASSQSIDLEAEAERFRLHAEANGRTAVNWNAAFTMWLSKATQYQAQRPPGPPMSAADRAVQRGKERHDRMADFQKLSWDEVLSQRPQIEGGQE